MAATEMFSTTHTEPLTNSTASDEVETFSLDLCSMPHEPKHDRLYEPEEDEELTVRLAHLQADPNSPLCSATSFENLGLKKELLKGIYEMKFTKPSKIQESALPLLLKNPPRNFIGQSQSGTGKTAAFVLTMLNRIDLDAKHTQALCVAPTRELARQIMEVVRTMGHYTTVTTDFAIRDGAMRRGVIDAQVVVGTPGTILRLIERKQLRTTNITILTVDEADNMLDSQSLAAVTVRIKNYMPPSCQLVLFSATWPENVSNFARVFAPDANEIRLKHKELTVDGIKQFYVKCNSLEHKLEVLIAIYSLLTIGQSIIFCRTRRTADAVAAAMQADGHSVISLHGAQDIETRDETIDQFRGGKSKVMISTNVTARGIDISQVNLVINYDFPVDANMRIDPETYLHRIGRSGRFGRLGASISFVHNQETWEEMNAMQEHFGKEITCVPTDSLEEVEAILRKALK